MKISFMTFACPQWSFEQVLAAAGRHRYHGIEFRCDSNHGHGVEVDCPADERRELRKQLQDAGIEPCCLATSLRFADEAVRADAGPRIRLAADLGCAALRVFCGPVPEGTPIEETVKRVGHHLARIAPEAQQAGVELWLETHDTFVRAADAVAAVRAADHPAIGINYDNMHPYRFGESLEKTAEVLRGYLRHTHFHDAANRADRVEICPLGEGELPIDAMFKLLLDEGYSGYLSGEWFGEQYGPDPDAALGRYRADIAALGQRHGQKI